VVVVIVVVGNVIVVGVEKKLDPVML